jgi:hypothetical protein
MAEDTAGVEFTIGRSFPADQPVARFVTVLAMMSNDLRRLITRLFDDDVDEGERIFYFRLLVSAFFEASKFLRESVPRWQELQAFVTSLDADARHELERVTGACDPESKFYLGAWVQNHRNVTFHYSQMHPERAAAGKEEIGTALRDASDIESSIDADEGLLGIRFTFADQVAVQWLPDGDSAESVLETLRELHLDLVQFTQRAFQMYLDSLAEDARPRLIGS